ncbi:M14 metallopeptidase family protein [uncultured Imperialibacter sp.]|mgnify:CR=1 FL=1|uniref:M14 family metallopeptidase n=1 Tax=uncultured Imperialibacter sp. TaxID=1672639 RepID=UPI0030D889CA
MKRSTFLFLTALLCQQAFGQQNEFLAKVEAAYDNFAEKSISVRRFKHSDVEPLLLNLKTKQGFSVAKAGESIEGRSIYLVKAGTGPVKVLLWSQMHGDETTATRVLLDLFNFLSDESTFAKEKEALLKGVTLYFIPILNPDGAEQFQRRNALGIDINRDAVRLQSPEAQLLKHVRDSLNPDFGFNLHDQNSATSAGSTGKPASLSFLAPAFNEAKDINASRKAALQVVVKLNNLVQNYMPGHTARYDDTFEPRAFGDNIQKWGTSTILIECGAYPNDPEKQMIRKVHFLALLGTLQSISDGSYKKLDSNDYFKIPENGRYYVDLLVKNGQLALDSSWYTMDLAIRLRENTREDLRTYDVAGYIEDVGDMSVYFGYDEIDATGMTIVPGKVYPDVFDTMDAIPVDNIDNWLQEGYTYVKVRKPVGRYVDLPVNVIGAYQTPDESISFGDPATFIVTKDGKVMFTVVNGMVYNPTANNKGVKNGVVVR